MLMDQVIGIVTVFAAIGVYFPYLVGTIRGTLTPHPFTWIIWVSFTAIGYAAQLSDNAGPGAWMNAAVILICIFIILFSFKNGFKNITLFDKYIFAIGLSAIPVWMITDDATLSVIIISVVNTVAYIPTIRKSYAKPYEEALYLYGVNFFRHGGSLFALTNLSLVTGLFPFVLALSNGGLALYLIWRRGSVGRR